MDKRRTFYFMLLMAVPFALARAEDRKPASVKTKVTYEKKTTLDFEEAAVDGQFLSPEGMGVKADKNLDFDSLMAPKNNFSRELRRSSGAVR